MIKPMIPDFCLACDNYALPLIKIRKRVHIEFRNILCFPDVTLYQCPVCGYDNTGPEYLEELISQKPQYD